MADLISTRSRNRQNRPVTTRQSAAEPDAGTRVPAAQAEALRQGDGSGQSAAAADRQEFMALVELLFFAYRGFTAEPDVILGRLGFGRAHHRVMHFVTRSPGLRVADLLEILRITKQSLARVLRQLVAEGYIVQEAGTQDRRERLLYPTPQGRALAEQLAQLQIERLERAIGSAGPGAERVARDFLLSLVADADRPRAVVSASRPPGGSGCQKA